MALIIPLHRHKEAAREIDDGTEILGELKERLRLMKLKVPRRPKDDEGNYIDPLIPSDITRLNDEQLGRLHSEFAAMLGYTYGQLGLRAADHAIARRTDKLLKARARLGKSGTNADKDAKTEIDTRTKKSTRLLLIAESTERLTQAVFEGYQVGRDLCSRELTRRMNVFNPNGR